ncbi:MAG TPA: MFS transporter, partial [Thermomicrobiaceae bacterium]|nr:MFS transporter [Thermomicrobiaceae bacterium]
MPDEQPAQLNDLQQSNMNGETGELVETAKPVIVPGRQKWLVLIAVSIGTFMATLDGSIVNISLPKIQEAFGVNLSTIEWVVVTYLLIRGALMLPFGRLGEMIGYKRVYITGFIIFTSASALCGISQSVWMLVGFRALQAFGGAMLSAIGPAIVTYTFGSGERGKALGLNSISVSIGLSIGPTVGGILTEYGSWRWIFWVNIPVG